MKVYLSHLAASAEVVLTDLLLDAIYFEEDRQRLVELRADILVCRRIMHGEPITEQEAEDYVTFCRESFDYML